MHKDQLLQWPILIAWFMDTVQYTLKPSQRSLFKQYIESKSQLSFQPYTTEG
jgi:hypothetical protein